MSTKPKTTTRINKNHHVVAERCELCGKLDLDVELSDAEKRKKHKAILAILKAADAEIDAGLYDDTPTEEFYARVCAKSGISYHRDENA